MSKEQQEKRSKQVALNVLKYRLEELEWVIAHCGMTPGRREQKMLLTDDISDLQTEIALGQPLKKLILTEDNLAEMQNEFAG